MFRRQQRFGYVEKARARAMLGPLFPHPIPSNITSAADADAAGTTAAAFSQTGDESGFLFGLNPGLNQALRERPILKSSGIQTNIKFEQASQQLAKLPDDLFCIFELRRSSRGSSRKRLDL